MRDEAFENSLGELWVVLSQGLATAPQRSFTKAELTFLGLAQKCTSHCEMALKLVQADASAESMIILRSAYEAIIKSIYLSENPGWLKSYEAFGELVTLRNQLEVIKILDEFGDPESSNTEQRAKIQKQQKAIIDAGFHQLYGIDESKLSDWNVLRSKTNSANLQKFETIRQSVIKTDLVKALLTTGFQAYNLGSQMAHSSYNMMTAMVYFKNQQPLYTEHDLYRQILLLLRCSIEQFARHGALDDSGCEAINEKLQDIKCKHFALLS